MGDLLNESFEQFFGLLHVMLFITTFKSMGEIPWSFKLKLLSISFMRDYLLFMLYKVVLTFKSVNETL